MIKQLRALLRESGPGMSLDSLMAFVKMRTRAWAADETQPPRLMVTMPRDLKCFGHLAQPPHSWSPTRYLHDFSDGL